MGTRIGMLSAVAVLVTVTASAQPYRLDRVLGTEFLTHLAQRGLLRSQVAIINASVGSIITLDRDAPSSVVFIDGSGNGVWAQVAEQLSESGAEETPMHLKVEHRTIDVVSCPAIIEHRTEFLAQLDAFDPAPSRTAAYSEPQVIILDATAYLVITSVVTIKPNGALDPPLQQAAGRLHSAVSRCAGSVVHQLQQHDF
jgi:hypothetical protein